MIGGSGFEDGAVFAQSNQGKKKKENVWQKLMVTPPQNYTHLKDLTDPQRARQRQLSDPTRTFVPWLSKTGRLATEQVF